MSSSLKLRVSSAFQIFALLAMSSPRGRAYARWQDSQVSDRHPTLRHDDSDWNTWDYNDDHGPQNDWLSKRGRWIYNDGHGTPNMSGWIFKQGRWVWGCCITWHVVDLNPRLCFSHKLAVRDNERLCFWVAYLWRWTSSAGWRHGAIFSEVVADLEFVEDWMIHADCDEDWVASGLQELFDDIW